MLFRMWYMWDLYCFILLQMNESKRRFLNLEKRKKKMLEIDILEFGLRRCILLILGVLE